MKPPATFGPEHLWVRREPLQSGVIFLQCNAELRIQLWTPRPTSPTGSRTEARFGFDGDHGSLTTARGDFRLPADTALVKIGDFPYLGALPPLTASH